MMFGKIYSKTTTDGQRLHHDVVHLVVDDVSSFSKVDRVDDWSESVRERRDETMIVLTFVPSIDFVSISISGLTTMSWV